MLVHTKPEALQITNDEWLIVSKILAKHVGHYKVWAFGSRVHPNHPKPYSDLDLVVFADSHFSIAQYSEIKEAFDESNLPWKVDLLNWLTLSDSFKTIIQKHYIEIQ